MANHITGLDHAIVAVRDLVEAAETFRRLGFTLTPKGHHAEWGTADHCLMFGQDHVELLAAEGPGPEADALRAFTHRRDGLIGMGLGSNECAATADCLRRAGLDVPVPRSLSRRLDDGHGTTLTFSEVPLPAEATPGIACRVVQPVTALGERDPQWTEHPNGALGIASVTAIVDEPIALTSAWDKVFGPYAAVVTDDTVTVHSGRGLIFLSRPDDITQLHPDAELEDLPPAPALVVLALRIADTGRAAEILRGNGVEFSRDSEGTIRIPPSQACGVFIELVGA